MSTLYFTKIDSSRKKNILILRTYTIYPLTQFDLRSITYFWSSSDFRKLSYKFPPKIGFFNLFLNHPTNISSLYTKYATEKIFPFLFLFFTQVPFSTQYYFNEIRILRSIVFSLCFHKGSFHYLKRHQVLIKKTKLVIYRFTNCSFEG